MEKKSFYDLSEEEQLKLQLADIKPVPALRWSCSRQRAKDILTRQYKLAVAERLNEPTLVLEGAVTVTPLMEHVLDTAAEFLTTPQRHTGLAFCGDVGLGKSTLMRAIQKTNNELHDSRQTPTEEYVGLHIVSYKDLCASVKNDSKFHAIRSAPALCIDDLARESFDVKLYGNTLKPAAEVIEYRYQRALPLFITTNLAPVQFAEAYGEHIADRMREMMTPILFKDQKSYRQL